jgi:hypothetical protein
MTSIANLDIHDIARTAPVTVLNLILLSVPIRFKGRWSGVSSISGIQTTHCSTIPTVGKLLPG